MVEKGVLYIVATPIGNPDDITLRAVETLKSADAVVCEEYKPGSTLLKKLGIEGKELVLLNEHNEPEVAADLLMRLLKGESLALFSDCGTPVFSDPGHYLIQLAASSGVKSRWASASRFSTSRMDSRSDSSRDSPSERLTSASERRPPSSLREP